MTYWVYVLKCEGDYIYVGETRRLFRRFNEHLRGRGGSNTIKHKPRQLIGLYKVNDNYSFIKYRTAIHSGEYNKFIIDDWNNDGDNLLVENHITHRLFYERRNNHEYGSGNEWYRIRGGNYTREGMDEIISGYKYASEKEGGFYCAGNPVASIPVPTIVDRPLCKCQHPSEVKISRDNTTIYFVCALKNVWGGFFSDLQIDEPCDFWQSYTEDIPVKSRYEFVKTRSNESWLLNVPLSKYKIQPDPCISCNKSGYLAIFNKGVRRLCQSCIINKYDILKEKYHTPECLITDS